MFGVYRYYCASFSQVIPINVDRTGRTYRVALKDNVRHSKIIICKRCVDIESIIVKRENEFYMNYLFCLHFTRISCDRVNNCIYIYISCLYSSTKWSAWFLFVFYFVFILLAIQFKFFFWLICKLKINKITFRVV